MVALVANSLGQATPLLSRSPIITGVDGVSTACNLSARWTNLRRGRCPLSGFGRFQLFLIGECFIEFFSICQTSFDSDQMIQARAQFRIL